MSSLCDVCRRIPQHFFEPFDSGSVVTRRPDTVVFSIQHHDSWAALLAAAAAGCPLCHFICTFATVVDPIRLFRDRISSPMVDGEAPMRLEIDSAHDWNEVRLKGSATREMRFTELPDTWGTTLH